MADMTKAREAVKKAIIGETAEDKENEVEEVTPPAEEAQEESVNEEKEEVEIVAKKETKDDTKTTDKKEDDVANAAENEAEEDEEDDKTKKQVSELKEKVTAQNEVIEKLKDELDAALDVINIHLENVIPKLSKEDQKLIDDLADTSSPLARYRALTTLQKHSKVSTSKKNAPRVSVDTTRVARADDTTAKPQSFNDARKAIRDQFLKLAK